MLIIILTRKHDPTSSSCGGIRPLAKAFLALRAKKDLILLFWPIFGHFWFLVVTLVTFSSNFVRNHYKTPKKSHFFFKKSKNPKKKNPKKMAGCGERGL